MLEALGCEMQIDPPYGRHDSTVILLATIWNAAQAQLRPRVGPQSENVVLPAVRKAPKEEWAQSVIAVGASMKQAGAATIPQDRATCVVFGMPKRSRKGRSISFCRYEKLATRALELATSLEKVRS